MTGLRDQIAATLRETPIGFVVLPEGDIWEPREAHGRHRYDPRCAVCRLASRPEALDAVCDALLAAGLVVPQPPNPPSDAKTLEEAWSEFRAGTRVDYDLRSTHDLVHIAFCAGWQGARGERVTPEPAAPTHEEMVQRWGVGFGTPYGNALYSWWLHMQREPTVEERSALMAAIDAGLRAGSAVPADPPATTLEEWTERNPKPWPWLGPDALLAWQQARDAAVPADPEEPA